MTKLILASRSPQRLALLLQAGFRVEQTLPTNVDETPKAGELPRLLVERLAAAKLEAARAAIFSRGDDSAHGDYVVLAADTVVALGRRVLPPPHNAQQARDNYARLSGRAHQLITSVAVANNAQLQRLRTVITRVVFKRLDKSEIERLVASNQWRGRAGGYAIQGLAGAMIRRINGSYSSVIGLPLCETTSLLRSFGCQPSHHDIDEQ